MKLTNLVKKISFIFTMLVCTLIVFCFPIKTVKAGNLTSLEVIGYENDLDPVFDPDVYEYNIDIPKYEIDIELRYTKQNNLDDVNILNNNHIKSDNGTIIINVQETQYKINYRKVNVEKKYEFNYSGKEDSFVIPISGEYKLETWGAQGGNGNGYIGGFGGYSVGNIYLNSKAKLFINVGGQGASECNYDRNCAGGYNGGGTSGRYGAAAGNITGGGGGATHIATKSGLLSTLSSDINKILIVASGGGGGYYHVNGEMYSIRGGSGGGIKGSVTTAPSGFYGVSAAGGGTQLSGGAAGYRGNAGGFGYGGNGIACSSCPSASAGGASGGGSGFYGGGAAGHNSTGGGSGYIANSNLIDKHMAGYNCETSTTENTKTISVNDATKEPKEDKAKMENGYAIITPTFDLRNRDNYLENLIEKAEEIAKQIEFNKSKIDHLTKELEI